MLSLVSLCFGTLRRLFRGWRSLFLENLGLRQQLVALKRRYPRPRFGLFDKLSWVIARRVWSAWKQSLIIVTPETVVRWHRSGFVNVTKHPTSGWIQQLREAFPFEASHKYLIFDRDQKFGFRGDRSGESHKDHSRANFIPESLAEWHRRAVGCLQ